MSGVSGYTTLAPAFWSSTYTSEMFASGTYLTKRQADTLYLSIGYISVISLLEGVTPGIAQASKVLALGSSKQVTGLGQFTWNDINDAIQIVNTSTSGRANLKMTNDISDYLELGVRGSLASNPRTYYMYSNGSYKALMDLPTGDWRFLSTTASSNYSTGALVLSGGLGLSGALNANGTIATNGVVNSFGSGSNNFSGNIVGNSSYTSVLDRFQAIFLQDSYTTSTSISGNGTSLRMQSASSVGVYGLANLSPSGLFINRSSYNPVGTCNSNSLLDFGSESHPFQINLFAGTYGITAADSATQILSGGVNGIYLGQGSGYTASTYTANLTQPGSFQVAHKLRACGTSNSGFSGWAGGGLELGWNGTYGEIYSYNRTTLLFKGIYLGQEIYTDGGGHTSIGIGPVASSWRLEVGSNTQNVSSYGYLNSSGSTGSSGSSGAVSFSAYFQGRIAVQGEVDVLSDLRKKKNIRAVTQEEAESFFNVEPKHYTCCPETNNDEQYGYLAQDLLKAGLDDVVCCREDLQEGLPEHIDHDGFVSPANSVMSVSYPKLTALLHAYVKLLEERVKNLEAKVFVPKEYSHADNSERDCDSNGDTKEDSPDSAPPKKPIRSRRRKEVVGE